MCDFVTLSCIFVIPNGVQKMKNNFHLPLLALPVPSATGHRSGRVLLLGFIIIET